MYRIEINVQEKILRQVGYLQGSNQDARSTKHKIGCVPVLGLTQLYVYLIIIPLLATNFGLKRQSSGQYLQKS